MKNQYFGDINDYRKYGILRILSNTGQISTLICWMLTENDSRADGKFISYLDNKKKFGKYDPELFDKLSDCNKSDYRNVDGCKRNCINYLAAKHDLVFLDPDNGLEIKSTRKGNKGSSKFLYYDELVKLYEQGDSLLIYQHFIREERNQFILRISDKLKESTGCNIIFPLITSNVVFFLIPKIGKEEYFSRQVTSVGANWGKEIKVSL